VGKKTYYLPKKHQKDTIFLGNFFWPSQEGRGKQDPLLGLPCGRPCIGTKAARKMLMKLTKGTMLLLPTFQKWTRATGEGHFCCNYYKLESPKKKWK
jgi:hypothetical protein